MQAANYVGTLAERLTGTKPCPLTETKYSETETARALEFFGTKDVRVVYRPKPMVTHAKDAVVRITTTTVCGSDLHLWHRQIPELEKGDVLGHEAVGIVESVGPGVTGIKPGQRVVISAILACGECWYCQHVLFSCCETTNSSGTMETLYGHHTAGILGYSHLLGGYDGAQAEYIRIPFADMNLLPVPDHLRDDQVICLSDIACTGWHGTDLGEVSGDDARKRVAVWGLGPVGLMAVRWAIYRGAEKVVAIDCVESRLKLAESIGAVPLNYKELDVYEQLKKEFPRGPDVGIDCVGFRYGVMTCTIQSNRDAHTYEQVLENVASHNPEGHRHRNRLCRRCHRDGQVRSQGRRDRPHR